MFSSALRRFEKSMNIGYEQWHDGIGYDLDAIDEMSASERDAAEKLLIPRASNDWRDLEALDRLGTPRAIEAIRSVRHALEHEIRLRAHQYGPPPTEEEWEQAILASLAVAEIYSGLTNALDCALEHPSQGVKDMLWAKVRDPESGVAYHCAQCLSCLAGVSSSLYDDQHRALFLRLSARDSADRTQAVIELERLLNHILD